MKDGIVSETFTGGIKRQMERLFTGRTVAMLEKKTFYIL